MTLELRHGWVVQETEENGKYEKTYFTDIDIFDGAFAQEEAVVSFLMIE